MKLRILVLGAVALLASLVSPAPVGAGPTATSVVAVLTNGDFVDTGSMAAGGELENVLEDLEAGGHTIVEFTDVSAAGLTEALEGTDVLVIPELEYAESPTALSDAMGADGRAVVAGWVDAGGRTLFFGSSDPAREINAIFGFSLVGVWPGCAVETEGEEEEEDNELPCVLTSAASATEFADAPATVPYVNDTSGLLPSSLPTGSTVIYEIEIDESQIDEYELDDELEPVALVDVAGVATMPHGDGMVVFLGWDWYPDAYEEPEDEEDLDILAASAEDEAMWAVVLDLAVSQPVVTATGGVGSATFTSDSPSTQPVLVSYEVGGLTQVATIAPGTTSVTVELAGPASLAWSVPGWGVGEGSVEVAAAVVTPGPTPTPTPSPTPGPAQPVVAQPTFTG